jgi:hypothetical protein
MKTMPWPLMVLTVALVGCGPKQETTPPAKTTNSTSSSGNPLTAPVDYLGALDKAKKVAEKTVDTASITKAIQAFQVEEERWPKDLNELVTKKYLPRLPDVPYGMKFDYNPQTGQFKVLKQ